MEREDYIALRTVYEPLTLKLMIVAESPPASGKYIYNPQGSVGEPLFAAFMKQLGIKPATKEEGLKALRERGWLLVDATYEPVNEYSNLQRDATITKDYSNLRDDLMRLDPNQNAGLILVKINVCRLLADRLHHDGFRVLNKEQPIPFPSTGQQTKFYQKFSGILAGGGY